jgi:hypothetical protein
MLLNAELKTIQPVFFNVVDVDADNVERIIAKIKSGDSLPPPVVVDLGHTFMPLDGHHRLSAYSQLGMSLQAWVVDEEAFEDLDIYCRDNDLGRAENNILCGGKKVFDVAAQKTNGKIAGKSL